MTYRRVLLEHGQTLGALLCLDLLLLRPPLLVLDALDARALQQHLDLLLLRRLLLLLRPPILLLLLLPILLTGRRRIRVDLLDLTCHVSPS